MTGKLKNPPLARFETPKTASTSKTAIAWTIAGSDSCSGAGIQADLKTMNALGVHACTVLTAVTAQNSAKVNKIAPVDVETVNAQIESLLCDMPPQAVKTGMLFNAEQIKAVSEQIVRMGATYVCDPVLAATSGDALQDGSALKAFISHALPTANLITPNIPEALALLGLPPEQWEGLSTDADQDACIETLARRILTLGPKSVLLKGGHRNGHFAQDFWTDGTDSFWMTSERQGNRPIHGTGCTLSAAITAGIAAGYSFADALVIAKAYVNLSIRRACKLGAGADILSHADWQPTEQDLPWITNTAVQGRERPLFPSCGEEKLGFYPIVDNSLMVETLCRLGVGTIQLRIKDNQQPDLEAQIAAATAVSNAVSCRLFINDHWELAIKYGAYGVHLGQTDIITADLRTIASEGLRLGVSTHCYEEVARALALRPSYIAVGPVFPTTTKQMPFAPIGPEGFNRWRKILTSYQLVAIGGIFLDNASVVVDAGADGIAVVRDIMQAESITDRVNAWRHELPSRQRAANVLAM